jgi:hypothetical protein
LEGEFEGRRQHSDSVSSTRSTVIRHADSLQAAGGVEAHRKEWATRGERAATVRHQDNLKLESGEFVGKQNGCNC